VDEAYEPFAHSSVIGDVQQHANLMVMRTLSKLGLAGLRLGYLAAAPGWINELDKLRLPYNINVLTQISVEFALRHYPVWEQQCQQMLVGREFLYGALKEMNSLHVWRSDANFLLCRVLNGDAPGLVESLKRQGLLIRLLHGSDPLLKDCVRISVGTPDQNQQLLAAIGYNQR